MQVLSFPMLILCILQAFGLRGSTVLLAGMSTGVGLGNTLVGNRCFDLSTETCPGKGQIYGLSSYQQQPLAVFQQRKQLKLTLHTEMINTISLRKQLSLLAPRRQGRFARRDVCPSTTEFHTNDDVDVYIIKPVVTGFQMNNCSILCFSWQITVKFWVLLRTSSSKTQMLLVRKNIFHEY